jgi:predicted nucleotidyltransferase
MGGVLEAERELSFAVLIGSRAAGLAQSHSDWDIAILWSYALSRMDTLGRTERLRIQLAKALGVSDDLVDLVDLRDANLTMRAVVAEEGQLLCRHDPLAWAQFLQRTWRELEDFYWEREHAA